MGHFREDWADRSPHSSGSQDPWPRGRFRLCPGLADLSFAAYTSMMFARLLLAFLLSSTSAWAHDSGKTCGGGRDPLEPAPITEPPPFDPSASNSDSQKDGRS